MDGQLTTWHRNIAENFNRLSRAHERYRQTDDRRTDDESTTYSERELEFTFAKNVLQERLNVLILFSSNLLKCMCHVCESLFQYRKFRQSYCKNRTVHFFCLTVYNNKCQENQHFQHLERAEIASEKVFCVRFRKSDNSDTKKTK